MQNDRKADCFARVILHFHQGLINRQPISLRLELFDPIRQNDVFNYYKRTFK
jgi:hypothetical protein